MTGDQDRIELAYRSVTGELVQTGATISESCPAPVPLRARQLRLDNGTNVRQVFLDNDSRDRASGYQRIDNEILAGLRLAWLLGDGGSGTYPPQVSRLHGYEPDSAEPFALLLPCRGERVGAVGRRMLPAEQSRFQVSLLQGLRWLGAAGIAHRGLSPATVRWDPGSQQVQITDFSLATVLGAPRTVVGTPPWAGPEQQPRRVGGDVSERDDIWGAGQLIYYVLTGEEVTGPQQLADVPDLIGLLSGVFTPPDDRPTAVDLLTRLYTPDPVPPGLVTDPLKEGRTQFYLIRAAKHDGPATPGGAAATRPLAPPASGAGGGSRHRSVALAISGLVMVLVLLGLVVGLLR